MKTEKIIYLLSSLLAMLFFYAVVSKMVNYQESLREMRNQVFPIAVADILVWLIPSIELGIVCCLIYEPFRRVGLWLGLSLLSSFSIYVLLGVNEVFDRVPCSCGGILWKNSSYWDQFWFNILFIVMAVIALWLHYLTDRRRGGAQPHQQIRKEDSVKLA
jgi:hypothetical protein